MKIIDKGIHAVIGASSFTGTVTGTISMAIVMIEVNGQLTHTLPVLIGTLCGYIVGTSISLSFFDTIIILKNFPYLPAIRDAANYECTAANIMEKTFFFLTLESTMRDLYEFLQIEATDMRAIPILQSKENKLVLLNEYIEHCFTA